MKTKSIDTKIASLVKLVRSRERKKKKPEGDQTKAVLQNLETNLETMIGLQKEVKNLKGTLKNKTKELETGLKNLKKERKKIKKARKQDKKSIVKVPVKKAKEPKPA